MRSRLPRLARAATILAGALFLAGVQASAQTSTDAPALKLLAQAAAARERSDRQEAVKLAKFLHLPLRTTVGGASLELFKFIGFTPIYRQTANVEAAQTISADQLWPGGSLGLSLNGSGINLAIWDDGLIRLTHQEFTGRAVAGDAESLVANHPTACAGTIMASGVVAAAKGMSFAANITSYGWNNDTAEMSTAAAAGLRLSSHSYVYTGSNWLYGFYLYTCQDWDQLAVNAPYYLICEAAGNNQGDNGKGPYDTVWPNGTAKNILTVGAANQILGGYQGDPSTIQLASFSSCGPTDDGRIKPDVLGCGVGLYTTGWGSDTDYTSSFSGTSAATPNISGAVGLLIQRYRALHAGADMRSATVKGLLIHTADHPNTESPDYKMGWGLVNCKTAVNVIGKQVTSPVAMQEATLSSGGTYTFKVASLGTAPLKVTICWTDPPGTEPTEGVADPTILELVNDLDLRITKDGTTYYPWVLDPANPANAATTGDNFRDNVEQVYIPAPTAGIYTVTVTHKGANLLPSGTQPFSVIVTGESPWVAGTVALQDYVGNATTVPLTVEIRTHGQTTPLETHTVYLDGSGNFAIPTSLSGTYDIACRGPHWLRQVVQNVAVNDSSPVDAVFSLINGDVTGDNQINLPDLTAIGAAWRSTAGSPNWNPQADLNGDGSVNLADWTIASKNWRKAGAQ